MAPTEATARSRKGNDEAVRGSESTGEKLGIQKPLCRPAIPFWDKKSPPGDKSTGRDQAQAAAAAAAKAKEKAGARVAPGPCLVGKGGHFRSPGTRGQILGKGKGPEREWLQALAWWRRRRDSNP